MFLDLEYLFLFHSMTYTNRRVADSGPSRHNLLPHYSFWYIILPCTHRPAK
jgi:hypothetical protein